MARCSWLATVAFFLLLVLRASCQVRESGTATGPQQRVPAPKRRPGLALLAPHAATARHRTSPLVAAGRAGGCALIAPGAPAQTRRACWDSLSWRCSLLCRRPAQLCHAHGPLPARRTHARSALRSMRFSLTSGCVCLKTCWCTTTPSSTSAATPPGCPRQVLRMLRTMPPLLAPACAACALRWPLEMVRNGSNGNQLPLFQPPPHHRAELSAVTGG